MTDARRDGAEIVWGSLGGTWITAPHVVQVGADKLALFTVGTDHVIRVRWRIDGEWGGWTVIPGQVIQVPHAVAGVGDCLDMFAIDHNYAIQHRQWLAGVWSDWQWMTGEAGGPTLTAPRAVWSTPDRLDIFVLGTNLGIWHKWRDGNGWSAEWSSLGSLWLTPPHVLSRSEGTIDAVSINSQSGLAHARMQNGSWSHWQTDDDISISRPFAVDAGGKLQVFVLGENRGVYHYTWDGEWIKPIALNGTVISPPRAVAWPDGGMDVFVVGPDSAVFSRSYRRGQWQDWVPRGGRAFSPPSLVAHDGVVELFALGVDSAIWHTVVSVN
jgi:hypothetical protein